jgi:hypothetical protein
LSKAILTKSSKTVKPGGWGIEIWGVPVDNIRGQLQGYYTLELLYVTARWLVRLSVLMFYLRIFQATNIRRIVWVTLVVTIVTTLPFLLVAAFQCTPVSFVWDVIEGGEGTCIDTRTFLWVSWAIFLVTDLCKSNDACDQISAKLINVS